MDIEQLKAVTLEASASKETIMTTTLLVIAAYHTLTFTLGFLAAMLIHLKGPTIKRHLTYLYYTYWINGVLWAFKSQRTKTITKQAGPKE